MSSASHGEAIGMMEGAFFVSRTELLAWVNDLLKLQYTKVEQCASGSAYCQIMDALYHGKVPLHKVNFAAKLPYEYLKNYKVLQEVFTKLQIQKNINVDKLTKGKYQDNLEFLQWMKRYHDIHNDGSPYDAEGRRLSVGFKDAPQEQSASSSSSTGSSVSGGEKSASGVSSIGSTKSSGLSSLKDKPHTSVASSVAKSTALSHHKAPLSSSDAEKRAKELTAEVAELKLSVDGLEKERNFYFGKLREIEIICQTNEDSTFSPILEKIQKILYATDEDFVATDEAGAEAVDGAAE